MLASRMLCVGLAESDYRISVQEVGVGGAVQKSLTHWGTSLERRN